MKKHIIIMVLFAAASMLASSCGKMGSSGIFGKLPSLNEEFKAKDQKFKEKGGNCKSQDEFLKLRKEYEEFEEKYKQLFAKQEEKLKGKEIPVELSEGIPFKVSKAFAITSVTSSSKLGAYITISGELEFTQDVECNAKYPYLDWDLEFDALGKDGADLNPSKKGKKAYINVLPYLKPSIDGNKGVYKAGSKLKKEINLSPKAENWASLEKIVIKKVADKE